MLHIPLFTTNYPLSFSVYLWSSCLFQPNIYPKPDQPLQCFSIYREAQFMYFDDRKIVCSAMHHKKLTLSIFCSWHQRILLHWKKLVISKRSYQVGFIKAEIKKWEISSMKNIWQKLHYCLRKNDHCFYQMVFCKRFPDGSV